MAPLADTPMAVKTKQKSRLADPRENIPGIASSVDFGFVAAKLRGRHRKLYHGEGLTSLARLRSLGDIGAELVGRREFVDHLDLERQIIRRHVEGLLDIAKLLSGPQGEIIDWMVARYLAENVKVFLRGMASGEAPAAIRPYLVDLPEPLSPDFEALSSAKNIEEVLNTIPLPELAKAARAQLDLFKENGKAFILEMAIDRAYYEGLAQRLSRLCPADKASCSPLVEMEVNIYNVLAALRGRFAYGLPAEDMSKLLARAGLGLSVGELRRILDADNLAAGIAAVPRHLLGRQDEQPKDASSVEAALWLRLHRIANRTYYRSTFDLGLVAGFFYIKRVELMNFIKIVEMVRMRISTDDIVRRLVHL